VTWEPEHWLTLSFLDLARDVASIRKTDRFQCDKRHPNYLRLVTILTQWHHFSLGPAVQLDLVLPRPTSQQQHSPGETRNGKELLFPCYGQQFTVRELAIAS
jgi:hypothetical protein